MGTKMRQIIFDIGGGIPNGKKYKAAQIGGPSGGCIPTEHLDIEIDYESLKTVGAMMGSGGLVVMDEDTCMVDVAKFFMDFIQRESCGKCIPCREGTRRMLEILQRITRARKNEKNHEALERFKGVMYLNRLAEVIKDTSLCGLGQTAPNPVLSTLRYFRDEYEAHIFERHCPAGACTELLTYSIDAAKCKGCTLLRQEMPGQRDHGQPQEPPLHRARQVHRLRDVRGGVQVQGGQGGVTETASTTETQRAQRQDFEQRRNSKKRETARTATATAFTTETQRTQRQMKSQRR